GFGFQALLPSPARALVCIGPATRGPAAPAPAPGRARARYNGAAVTPTWGLNTYYAYGVDGFSEETLLKAARAAIERGLWAAGYRMFGIDDGWSARDRDADGNLVADPQKFPSGIAATVSALHALGFSAGIYGDMGGYTCGGRAGSDGAEARDAQWFAVQGFD